MLEAKRWPPARKLEENFGGSELLMKKIIASLALFASLAILVVSVSAQTPAQTPAPAPAQTPAQGGCTDEAKNAWYTEFTANRTSQPAKAYEAAKKYLAACPAEAGDIPNYLKKWTGLYEKELRKTKLTDLFVNQRKYPEAYALAKEILVDEPDNPMVLMDLGYGGYVLAVTTKNESLNAEAVGHAKNAIQQIEAGKAPASWLPFKSKDDALAYLNYSVGYLERNSNPTEALTYFVKSTQFESELKKSPQTYAFIAGVYESQYAKQSADYEVKHKDKDETTESKLAVENINQVVDRIIDALARSVALAGTDPASQQLKTQWKERLTELYKFRHNQSDAGLNEMIASVLSKPLPPVPTPITTLPSTPTSTTTPTSGAASTSGAGSGNSMAPSTTSTTSTTPASTTTTAPKTTTPTTPTTPVKPKPRNNHRRRN